MLSYHVMLQVITWFHLLTFVSLWTNAGSVENFLDPDFDVKEQANTVLQSGVSISTQLSKISEGIIILNKELHAQVVAHHDNLLSQATGVETLEGMYYIWNRVHTTWE